MASARSASPIGMKKSRPGVLLACLCREEDAGKLAEAILRHTTTLGVRRMSLARTLRPAQDPFKQICTVLFLSFLTANTLRSRIPFVFRTISLWAAQASLIFCVLHVDLLPKSTKD